jgi:signal transduction histidine kinase
VQLKTPVPEAISIVDTVLLRNVFVNILENSAKYKVKDIATVFVSAEQRSCVVEIRLADDGPGVEPKDLKKLFDVFYRTDPSRGTKGNGLGLAISAKILSRMGGKISAELAPLGGLTIVITLPITEGKNEKDSYRGG